MSRRSPRASRLPTAYALLGSSLLLACWNGCEIDRSGLSGGGERPGGSGGLLPSVGTGAVPGIDTGGSSIHFGTGGVGVGSGGHATGGEHESPGTGGTAGAVGSGGNGSGGEGTGGRISGSGGGAGQTNGTGGAAGLPSGKGGGGGIRPGGRGGSTASTGGTGNWGSGGWWMGGAGRSGSTGGSEGGPPMCDPSIRERDPCDVGTPACRKSCGVSALATKPCSCTNRQWTCGDCVYPSGDYSCYKLPAMSPPPCPPSTVNGLTACAGSCTQCSNYTDTSGLTKMGYCACTLDAGDSARAYHCASSSEWPPQ